MKRSEKAGKNGKEPTHNPDLRPDGQSVQQSPVPAPKPILHCRSCKHDLAPLIETPWIRKCPECGSPFDPDFIYEGNPPNHPEPNIPPPPPRHLDRREPDDL